MKITAALLRTALRGKEAGLPAEGVCSPCRPMVAHPPLMPQWHMVHTSGKSVKEQPARHQLVLHSVGTRLGTVVHMHGRPQLQKQHLLCA